MTGYLQIGRWNRYAVRSIAHAAGVYSLLRDESGEGASGWPEGRLEIDGHEYLISYNGKVWQKNGWNFGDVPVFNPYESGDEMPCDVNPADGVEG